MSRPYTRKELATQTRSMPLHTDRQRAGIQISMALMYLRSVRAPLRRLGGKRGSELSKLRSAVEWYAKGLEARMLGAFWGKP